MSLHSLHIASGALLSSQLQIDITARNLSGAQQPGYTRQRALVRDVGPGLTRFDRHSDGLGIMVDGFERVRESLLDSAFRTHHRDAEGARAVESLSSRLESVMGDSSGLKESAQEIRLSLLEVASHPEDVALRSDLFQKLESLTGRFQEASQNLDGIEAEGQQRRGELIDRSNEIFAELADLNQRLPAFGKSSGANALLDRRDSLVDELSGIAEVRTVPQNGGAVAVYLDGRQMVYGKSAQTLSLDSNDDIVTGDGVVLDVNGGSLGALNDFSQAVVPGFQSDLDSLAQTLISGANQVHQVGYGLDGIAGRDLFSGTGARDIEVAINDQSSLGAAASFMESTDSFGTVDFNSDASLASQAANLTTPAAASGVVDVNGVSIAWNDTQSVDEILGAFASAGVEATFSTASGRISLQRDLSVTGPADITVTDVSGNLSSVFALDSAVSAPASPGDGSGMRALQAAFEGPINLEDGFSGLETSSGSYRRRNLDDTVRHGLLEADADQRRNAVGGVSSDEELLALERYQQSYAAAARIATTADEVLTTLMNMGAR